MIGWLLQALFWIWEKITLAVVWAVETIGRYPTASITVITAIGATILLIILLARRK